MSILYIRLPSRAMADSLQPGMPLYCEFASVSAAGRIEREGVAALPELADPVKRAQRVVLLLAAADVTLLRVQVPPLSATRLRAALPNLVEDQLMSDPAECAVVAGESVDGLRTVGVVQRGWLELLNRSLQTMGARSVAALPAQLCLPWQADMVHAAVSEQGMDAEVAARLGAQEGIGLSVAAEQQEALAFEVIQSLVAVVPQAPLTLYVPQARERDYRESLHIVPGLEQRMTLQADSWQRWIAGANQARLDLMGGLNAAGGRSFDWRPWRWPLALAVAVVAVNAAALNVDWLRARREADALNAGMVQSYRNAYPKETVIVDPVAQMRQKLAAARRESGQLAPDDFIALAAAFGQAWSESGQSAPLAGLEYHDRSLVVKPPPGSAEPGERLRNALAAHNLVLTPQAGGAWQIRSAR